MKIAFVGAQNAPHEVACTHWSGIRAAAKRLPHEVVIFCCRSGPKYVDDIIEWKPDVIVYNLIDMVHDKIEDSVRIREGLPNAKIVFWYTDCRTPETGQIDTKIDGLVDLFCTSSDDLDGFHKAHFGMKPEYLPQAAEPTPEPVYSSKVHSMYGDFVFVGGKYPRGGFMPRFRFVRELEAHHGLKVINGDTVEDRAKVYKAMPRIYGSAKFTLDISHFWDVPRYASNRYWVIPAVHGFALTKRFPGCETLYPEEMRVYWDTVDELVSKIEYFKKHEYERQKMIHAAWEHTRDNHTYEHRVLRILDLLGF